MDDQRDVLFPELSDLSVIQRESLNATDLRKHITEKKLASFPLEVCSDHDIEGLYAIADKITRVATEWPSCAIALCMHYNVLITLHRMPVFTNAATILESVKNNEDLIASAFSEFLPERGIFSPAVELARPEPGKITLSGSKKPCTLSSLANHMIVSCCEPGVDELRLALVPRHKDLKIDDSTYRFAIFGASDTSGIVFNELDYPSDVLDQVEGEQNCMVLLNYGMSLFNILIGSCYGGIVNLLVSKLGAAMEEPEIAKAYGQFSAGSQVLLKNMIKTTVEGIDDQLVSEVLILRYQFENNLQRFVELLWAKLGSRAILGDPDILHLLNTCRMIRYHPLTEKRFLEEMMDD